MSNQEDCYFFYYSSCTRERCRYRHEPAALGVEKVCNDWIEGRCFNLHCSLRHKKIKKDKSQIPCYWESQPRGCKKKHCVYQHSFKQTAEHTMQSSVSAATGSRRKPYEGTSDDDRSKQIKVKNSDSPTRFIAFTAPTAALTTPTFAVTSTAVSSAFATGSAHYNGQTYPLGARPKEFMQSRRNFQTMQSWVYVGNGQNEIVDGSVIGRNGKSQPSERSANIAMRPNHLPGLSQSDDGSAAVDYDDRELLQLATDQSVDIYRRIRVLQVARTELRNSDRARRAVELLNDTPTLTNILLADVIDAVCVYKSYADCRKYLQTNCPLCCYAYPRRMIWAMPLCQCKICTPCVIRFFEIVIKENHIQDLICPLCEKPDFSTADTEIDNHLQILCLQLKFVLSEACYELLNTKLTYYHLAKDNLFRHCVYKECSSGFLIKPYHESKGKIQCPHCKKWMCHHCKSQWMEQHAQMTCKQFSEWRRNNDPDFQQAALDHHMEENGFECPKCRTQYSLARGGCLHITCFTCKHEFCFSCLQPFFRKDCSGRCRDSGLHCHHPRNCFYYLERNSVENLIRLLERHGIPFLTRSAEEDNNNDVEEKFNSDGRGIRENANMRHSFSRLSGLSFSSPDGYIDGCSGLSFSRHPGNTINDFRRSSRSSSSRQILDSLNNSRCSTREGSVGKCPIKLSLTAERDVGVECGGKALVEYAGLCEMHYKEHLVGLIRKHKIDPVQMMDVNEIKEVLNRYDVSVPAQKSGENHNAYHSRLTEIVQTKLPIN